MILFMIKVNHLKQFILIKNVLILLKKIIILNL